MSIYCVFRQNNPEHTKLEQVEVPATLLPYCLSSNKPKINQDIMEHNTHDSKANASVLPVLCYMFCGVCPFCFPFLILIHHINMHNLHAQSFRAHGVYAAVIPALRLFFLPFLAPFAVFISLHKCRRISITRGVCGSRTCAVFDCGRAADTSRCRCC